MKVTILGSTLPLRFIKPTPQRRFHTPRMNWHVMDICTVMMMHSSTLRCSTLRPTPTSKESYRGEMGDRRPRCRVHGNFLLFTNFFSNRCTIPPRDHAATTGCSTMVGPIVPNSVFIIVVWSYGCLEREPIGPLVRSNY